MNNSVTNGSNRIPFVITIFIVSGNGGMEIIMKYTFSMGLLALAATLTLCGCTSSTSTSEQAITPNLVDITNTKPTDMRIAWWGSQNRHDTTIKVFNQFAVDNNMKINYEYYSWNSYFETLATQSVGDNLPDIIQQAMTEIKNYADSGKIIDLQPYVDNGTLDLSDVDESVVNSGKIDGKLVGISLGTNTMSIIYNKEVFEEAGIELPTYNWTWDEFIEKATQIYEKTGIQTEMPGFGEPRYLLEFVIRSYGYPLFAPDGKSIGFDESLVPKLVEIVQECKNLEDTGVFVDSEVQNAWATNEDRYIVKDKAAMSMIWSNYYTVYCEIIGKELGITTLPAMSDATHLGMYLQPSQFFSITDNCENPQLAARALSYFINDVDANKIMLADRGVPVVANIRSALKDDVSTYSAVVFDFVGVAADYSREIDPPEPTTASQATNVLKDNFAAVMYGDMTAQECIDDFVAQSKMILK